METATTVEMMLSGVEFLPIGKLRVDADYQRPLDMGRVSRMAKTFEPDLYAPPLVSRRGGVFNVIDGQHRVELAKMLGFKTVPCLVTRHSQAEEALLFERAQSSRKAINALDRHRALLVAGDPYAVELDRIMRSAGSAIGDGDSANMFRCVSMLERVAHIQRQADVPMLLERTVSVLLKAWPSGGAGRSKIIVFSLSTFIHAFHQQLDDDELVKRLQRQDPRLLVARICSATGASSTHGGKIGALEILGLYNKGRRSKQFDPARIAEAVLTLKKRKRDK